MSLAESHSEFNDLLNAFDDAARQAGGAGQTRYAHIDLDRQTFWTDDGTAEETAVEADGENYGETGGNEETAETPLPENIFVYDAANSREERGSGEISFAFYPDGTREFGLLHLRRADDGRTYTLFLHPLSRKIKIIEGEAAYEEIPY